MKNILNNKKGFTLIELLVVISIISLLTSIVLSSLADAKAKGRDAARIRSLIETRTALQMYFNDNGSYPNTNTFDAMRTGSSYIKSINSEIIYRSNITNYHMGIKLERQNSVLNSDMDSSSLTIYGNSTDCVTNSGADLCYDFAQ